MWVFGYGSLMWDKWEEDHDYRRHSIAELQGFQRTFNKASTKNWGTKDMPCPTLNLEANPSASCKGVAFEFGDDKRDRLLRYLKEREGEDFELQEHQIRLKDGESIVAVVPIYVGKNRLSEIDLANSAAIVRAAKGERGVCFDYVRSVFDALSKLGIEDPAVTRFWQAIQESVTTTKEKAALAQDGQKSDPATLVDAATLTSKKEHASIEVMSVGERLDGLISTVKMNLRAGMDEEVQRELAELLVLLPDLQKRGDPILTGLTEIAEAALLLDKPDLVLASTIREKIKSEARPSRNPLVAVFRGGSPSTTVIMGLGALLYVAFPFSWIGLPIISRHAQVFGIDTELLLLVSFAGALGSIVSILVRIGDFADVKGADSSLLFFTGFFKPVIGASFAMFVFAVLRSGLVPVTIKEDTAHYFFLALAFVSGFSERFAADIATTTERQFGGTGNAHLGDKARAAPGASDKKLNPTGASN